MTTKPRVEPQQIALNLPDGNTNRLTVYLPENKDITVLLFLLPAMGVKASYYSNMAETFLGQGICVAMLDLRGLGGSSVRASRASDFGYHEILEYDIRTAYAYLVSHFPNASIFLLGHSLGGQLGCLFAASGDAPKIKGIILSAACSVYWKNYEGYVAPAFWLISRFFKYITLAFGYFPGKKIGFGGTEGKTVLLDWSHQVKTGKYVIKNSSVDFMKKLSETRLPILSICYKKDGWAPKRASEHLQDMFHPDSPKSLVELAAFEGKAYNHFNWAKMPNEVVGIVKDWLENQ